MVRIHAAALPWAWAQISSGGNGVSAASDPELSFLFLVLLRFLPRRTLQQLTPGGSGLSGPRLWVERSAASGVASPSSPPHLGGRYDPSRRPVVCPRTDDRTGRNRWLS